MTNSFSLRLAALLAGSPFALGLAFVACSSDAGSRADASSGGSGLAGQSGGRAPDDDIKPAAGSGGRNEPARGHGGAAAGDATGGSPDAGQAGNDSGEGGTASGGGAAGEGGAGPMLPPEPPSCGAGPFVGVCRPGGFPFVDATFPLSDTCNDQGCAPPQPILTHPESGKLCLAGDGSSQGSARIALMLAVFVPDVGIVKTFNADALGITQVAFTVTSPPAGGLVVDSPIVVNPACAGFLAGCLGFSFELPQVATSGRVKVPLTAFAQAIPNNPLSYDTANIGALGFSVAANAAYDFCISDLEFFDADNHTVHP